MRARVGAEQRLLLLPACPDSSHSGYDRISARSDRAFPPDSSRREASMATLFRRRTESRPPAMVGREFAVGLGVPESVRAEAPDRADEDLVCRSCRSGARVDMVDTAGQRAYLTCARCDRHWEADLRTVRPGLRRARWRTRSAQ